jgi:hypothetical protein
VSTGEERSHEALSQPKEVEIHKLRKRRQRKSPLTVSKTLKCSHVENRLDLYKVTLEMRYRNNKWKIPSGIIST